MYLQGHTQAQIGAAFSVSQQTISKDLVEIREGWKKSAIVDFDEMRNQQLAKIDALELEYWDSWRASKTESIKQSKIEERIGTTEIVAKTKLAQESQERDGNPAFLAGVQWCIERRIKLFGLDEPETIRALLSGPDGGPIRTSIEEFETILKLDEEDYDLVEPGHDQG